MWYSHANSGYHGNALKSCIWFSTEQLRARQCCSKYSLMETTVSSGKRLAVVWSNHEERSLAVWTTYKQFSTQIKKLHPQQTIQFALLLVFLAKPIYISCSFDSLCAEVQICQPNDLHAAQVKRGYLPPACVPYVCVVSRCKHRFFGQEGPSLEQ